MVPSATYGPFGKSNSAVSVWLIFSLRVFFGRQGTRRQMVSRSWSVLGFFASCLSFFCLSFFCPILFSSLADLAEQRGGSDRKMKDRKMKDRKMKDRKIGIFS